MISSIIKSEVSNGLLGLNSGIPHGFDRLQEFIPDIQRSTYYLIGGESGTGKSAFAYNTFVFNPINHYLGLRDKNDLKVDIWLYSFEIPIRDVLIKAVCRQLYLKYNILLDVNYVLSRGKHRISDEYYQLVCREADELQEIEDHIHIKDIPTNPTGIWKDMISFHQSTGSGIPASGDLTNVNYKPSHSNHYVIVIIDHVALALKERGYNTKEVIDKLSEYLVILRNKLGITPVVVQQLNRSLSSTDRFKQDRVDPQLSDFKDTGNTIQDSNVCLALFAPNRYEIPEYRGYDITSLKDRFRSLSLLKNRDGEADKRVGLGFVGECGYFKEMPKVTDMNLSEYQNWMSIKKSY